MILPCAGGYVWLCCYLAWPVTELPVYQVQSVCDAYAKLWLSGMQHH